MEKLIIDGGKKLSGEVLISSAKNSILPIIAACILSKEKCIIENAAMLHDVYVICEVLRDLGCQVDIDTVTNNITLDPSNIVLREPNEEMVRKMRASFLIMGPMVARFKQFKISMPGGCNIGSRPIDLHLKGFKALGAEVDIGYGFVKVTAEKLVGSKIYLDFPSVGATENIMMLAVMAKGVTTIENAAEEPEIFDLANFLNSMGARITGAGTGTIIIEGVNELHGGTYRPIFDRIEAGTYLVAAAITRSKIKLKGVSEEYLRPVISKLQECGVAMDILEDGIIADGSVAFRAADVKTMPYPGFPTDMQAQMMSLLALAQGTSVITETVFENRFMHVTELCRMGANIKIDGRVAIIDGVARLTGSEVKASDLRAGAALILAALAAEGRTVINDVFHIDRGYVNIEGKLKGLGASIQRINL